jgi:hypothetical protein
VKNTTSFALKGQLKSMLLKITIKHSFYAEKQKKTVSLVKKSKNQSMQLLYSNYTNVFLAAELRKIYNLSEIYII